MGIELEKVIPWGRSYDEYVRMFDLTETDLRLRILGCGDGPASFNATLSKRGGDVVSIDPTYVFDAAQIERRLSETYDVVMSQMRQNQDDYVWQEILSVDHLGQIRMSAMADFLQDFPKGKDEHRYIPGELPVLPFEADQFDLALCSHFLFLYSAHFSSEFHIQAITELLRVAREVRIFPILTLDGTPSPYVQDTYDRFSSAGYDVETTRVPYEFQRDGNQMLVIRPRVQAHRAGA